ncbi:MAG: gliding motility-associated C-terminal domain-containing protein [Crocinitomicaceae bacterium]
MKKFNLKLLKPVVVLIAFAITQNVFAADYYWVNGSGNWNDPAHWSTSSGGIADANIPDATDNIIFDPSSFSNESYPVVYLTNDVSIGGLEFSAQKTISILGENNSLTVQGDFIANSKFYLLLNRLVFSSNVNLNHTIQTAHHDIGANIVFEAGSWTLNSSLKTTIGKSISFESGSVYSNGQSIFSEYIYANTNTVTLDFSGSVVYAAHSMNLEKANDLGTQANFFTGELEVTAAQKGGFLGSQSTFTKDQTTLCDDLTLTIDIVTIDYNGGWNVSCNDSCDGQIIITASGTPGPYSYRIKNTTPFTSQTVYDDLCADNYLITVVDSSNELGGPGSGIYYQCSVSELISPPPPLQLDLLGVIATSCPTSCDGQAFTSPQGGTAPYTVSWSPSGEVTSNPVALCSGDNEAVVVDDNGCIIDTSFSIPSPPPISVSLTFTEPTCNGDCDGEVDINPAGGNGGPYTYSWSPVPTSGQGTNPGIGFCAGPIDLSIFDVDGCQQDTTFTMTEPPVLTITASQLADATCFNACDGQATSTPAGGAGGNTFEWFTCAGVSTGITDQNPTTLCAGDYFVVVTDNGGTGCTAQSACITINEPTEVLADAQVYQISCFGICDGAVDVDASGGTPLYSYSWVTVPAGVGVGASDSLAGMCAGIFEVTVTDDNGCTSEPDTVEIIEPPQLTLSIAETDPTCYDLCDGSATATAGGGTPGYLYNWTPAPGTGQGTDTPTDMCAGTYDLEVTDQNGCTITDQVTLTAPPLYDISSTQTNLQCAGDANGTISVTVNSGGSGSGYTYSWAPAPPIGAGTDSVSGLTAGIWCVTISDDMACDTTLCFTITEPPVLTVNASVISQVSCFGDCNGSAQVVINGGVSPYDILWDDPSAQTTAVAGGLCAGNYIVTVTDDNGCDNTDNITITEPGPFDLDTSHTDISCFGDCSGTATVTVNSGGIGPYNHQWDDPLLQTSTTATNLCAGNYTVTITDQNLCDTIVPFTVIEPAEIIIDTNVINSACFGDCSGEASVSVSGGSGAYNYEWFNAGTGASLGNNNDTISNLCPGDYYAQITDGNGCVVNSDTLTITELPEIFTSVISTTDATCGVCDGAAEVSASGGTGTFTFNWTPVPGTGQGTASVTGLCAGVYNVVATDQAGCSENIAVTINSVAVEVTTMSATDITCFGLCDGTATISYTSVDPPYTVEWFDNQTGLPIGIVDGPPASEPSTANGLCAGEYLAVLTNSTGCVTSDTISVSEPPEITGSIVPTNVSCNGACDGSATVSASGGTGPLTYAWNPLPGSGQGTPNASGLCAGNWDVTVTDSLGCNENFSITISEPVILAFTTETSTDISCFGDSDGTATVIHSGGIGPYSYQWFDCDTGLPIGQTTQTATGLGEGDYQVTVTDVNGCNITSSCLPVIEPDGLTAILNSSPVNCYDFCDGLMDVAVSGGTSPYFYQWQDEFGNPLLGQTNDTMNNVCQGVYNIEVTDFNGCSQTFGPIDMTAPTNPWDVSTSQTDVSCSGSCDGTATVTVFSGNTPPYTFQWDDPLNQITPTATNLCAGVYNVTISDANICDTVVSVTILDASPVFANADVTHVLCFGECTGEIALSPSGGNPPYTVTWSDSQVGDTAFALCAGPITATITDASGCTKDTTITITEPTELSISSTFSNNSSCGICNGSATVNISGGTPSYTYNWSPAPGSGQGTNNATGLCPGITSVDITDQNNCLITEVFAISDINSESLTMDSTDVSCFGVCDGAAEVIYVCSDPGCTNQWYDGTTGTAIPGETATTISSLCTGDYYVEVTNASGCVAVGLTTITGPTQIMANDSITPISCNGAADGEVFLTPSGGSGAGYTYVWTPAPPNGQGTDQALNLTAGTWCVDITDGTSCTQSYCFDLNNPSPISITPTITDPSCNGSCNGIISVSVSGGYGGYTYQWLDGGGTPIPGETNSLISGLCSGNHTIEVTDAGGCVASLTITLTEPSPITSPITETDITCFGDCNGTATVNPSGGFAPYIINWYNSTTGLLIGQSGTTATNLCQGDYHAIITDNNGCNLITPSVTVDEPAELTWTLNSNDASCFGVCDGDAEIIPAGGTPVYQYEWLDITGTPIVGGTNAAVSNLCEGNYSVELTDDNGCSSGQLAVDINGFPEITANVFSNDATCGVSDGNATVFPNGGNPGYTYQWLDDVMTPLAGETNNTLINVSSGIYYVEVSDANGCTEVFQATISDLPSTTLTWDAVNHPSCFGGNDGSLEITTTAVNPPLVYTWNPGGIIAEDPTNLTAGTWTLQITDAMGCINFYDTTLVDPIELNVSSTSTPSDCGQCNGTIDLSITGGTGSIDVMWNNSLTGTSITDLCASIYEAQITDDNGCLLVEQVEVPNTGGLTANQTVTAISCAGSCDGEVTVSGNGGTAPYSYLWLHDNSTSDTQIGLCAGSYYVEVSDMVGCTFTVEVVMPDPPAIEAVATINNPACGLNDGSITVSSSSGILPHSYQWDTGPTTNAISNLSAGTYTLTITDNAGCAADFTYGLSNSNAAVVQLAASDINCSGICDGEIDTLSATGGTPVYTFQWLDETGAPLGINTPLITGLCEGDYILETTDNAGCVSYVSASISEPDTILLNPMVEFDPSCNGLCDGQLISNPFGGTLPFSFLWDDPDGQTNLTADSLCAGTYNLLITDANGCVANQSGTIIDPPAISVLTDNLVDATCHNSPDGEIAISISGGTPGYTTQWVSQTLTDTLTTEDIQGLLPMNYYLTVTDTNGCIYQDTILVDTALVVLANAGLDTLLCSGFGTILTATSTVDPNATFTWYDTSSTTLSNTAQLGVNNSAGVEYYIVEASFNGCSHTDTVIVTTASPFSADAGPDLEMFATQTEVIGGNPTSSEISHVYNWTPSNYLSDTTSSNPSIIEPMSSGWYYVTVTDTNGCTAIDSMYLELRPELVIPDGISPDGNGLNDTWILDFLELYPGVAVSINVYNRWGEPLFNSDENYQDDWGGTTRDGKRLPAGTYYYTIEIDHEDFPEPFTGPITIMW